MYLQLLFESILAFVSVFQGESQEFGGLLPRASVEHHKAVRLPRLLVAVLSCALDSDLKSFAFDQLMNLRVDKLQRGFGEASFEIEFFWVVFRTVEGFSNGLQPAVSRDPFEPNPKGTCSLAFEVMHVLQDPNKGILKDVFDFCCRDIPSLHPTSHQPGVF